MEIFKRLKMLVTDVVALAANERYRMVEKDQKAHISLMVARAVRTQKSQLRNYAVVQLVPYAGADMKLI
jgi:hypothetical protein